MKRRKKGGDIRKSTLVVIMAMSIMVMMLSLFLGYSLTGYIIFPKNEQVSSELIGPTKDNFNLFLERQAMVQELPDDAVISLRLYNFNNGEREWEKSYVITKGSVREGVTQNPDFNIMIHSKYIEDAAKDICSTAQKADLNGDFAADTQLSVISIMWKYKSVLKYRSCFGV